jgi:hypothetical protein
MKKSILKLVLFLFTFLPVYSFSQGIIYNEVSGIPVTTHGSWGYENSDKSIPLHPEDIIFSIGFFEFV